MKIIALEEHLVTDEIVAAWQETPGTPDFAIKMSTGSDTKRRLLDVADLRIASMDDAGIDVQVLSVSTPGVQSLAPGQAGALARAANDAVGAAVLHRPDRFQGFATLPTGTPDEAARELKRAVRELGLSGAMLFGRTGDLYLDHPSSFPILEAAAELRIPLYLHPQSPVPQVRDAYYQGLGPQIDGILGTGGIGWHYGAGLQALRLILSGVLEKLPHLQLILGHWGEVVLFYLDRIDLLSSALKLPRALSDYFKTNIFVTPGGIYTHRYLRWAIEVMGADRILFATDYPFNLSENCSARRFLETADLSNTDKEKIAFGNWERLCASIQR